MPQTKCPQCGRRKTVQKHDDGDYICTRCRILFDDDPLEGGDYSETNPAARLERQERRRKRG